MRVRSGWRAVCAAGWLVVGASAHADAVNKCEAPDRSVVYSNEACPPGTKLVRSFDTTPPVVVHDGKDSRLATPADARGDRAGDTKGGAKGLPATNRVERAAVRPRSPLPDEAREAADERRKQKIGECDDLVRKVEFAQRDLAAAAPSDRASAELALRRLQQQHTETCGPPRR